MDEICGNDFHGWMQSDATGKQLHYRKFLTPATTKTKGIVVFLHGVHGQTGLAFRLKATDGSSSKEDRFTNLGLLSRALNAAGYDVYAADYMGHGFSEGERFYIPDWKIHRDDSEQFCRFAAAQHDEDLPFFLTGQSYGGGLAIHVARLWQDHSDKCPKSFKGFVSVCPAIIGDLPPLPVVWTLRYGLAPMFPKWTPSFMPHPVRPERVWTDERIREMASSPRIRDMGLSAGGKAYCLGTAVALLNVTEAVRSKVIPGLNMPFCTVHGTQDLAVPIAGSEYLMEHSATPEKDKALLRIEGARHDLFSEPNAEDVVSQMLKWMESRMMA